MVRFLPSFSSAAENRLVIVVEFFSTRRLPRRTRLEIQEDEDEDGDESTAVAVTETLGSESRSECPHFRDLDLNRLEINPNLLFLLFSSSSPFACGVLKNRGSDAVRE